jgi:hypothetical protein
MVFVRPLLKRRLYASIDAEAGAPPSFQKKENEIDYLLKIFSGLSITFFCSGKRIFYLRNMRGTIMEKDRGRRYRSIWVVLPQN